MTVAELSDDSVRLVQDLGKETDRGVALVGGAFLDAIIGNLLLKSLANDKKSVQALIEYPGPVNASADRANLAYCVGLVGPKTLDELKLIRKIRNHFAHMHRAVSFEQPGIKELCDKLGIPRQLRGSLLPGPARDQFTISVVLLSQDLLAQTVRAKPIRISEDRGVWETRLISLKG